MQVRIYWIDREGPGRVGIMPRPRGDDWLADEIRSLKAQGVDVIVSLLEDEEIRELDLLSEESCCRTAGISYLRFPIRDREVPVSVESASDFVRPVVRRLHEGSSIVVHCRQGVGRSALVAACLLVSEGAEVDTVFERIAAARGCPVPDTVEQRMWPALFLEFQRSNLFNSARD